MAARAGDFDRAAREELAADVGQIGRSGSVGQSRERRLVAAGAAGVKPPGC